MLTMSSRAACSLDEITLHTLSLCLLCNIFRCMIFVFEKQSSSCPLKFTFSFLKPIGYFSTMMHFSSQLLEFERKFG